MTERFEKFFFDLLRESFAISFTTLKNHVAALNEGPDILETQRLDDPAQGFHLDQFLAADVDAAQECDVLDHLNYVAGDALERRVR